MLRWIEKPHSCKDLSDPHAIDKNYYVWAGSHRNIALHCHVARFIERIPHFKSRFPGSKRRKDFTAAAI